MVCSGELHLAASSSSSASSSSEPLAAAAAAAQALDTDTLALALALGLSLFLPLDSNPTFFRHLCRPLFFPRALSTAASTLSSLLSLLTLTLSAPLASFQLLEACIHSGWLVTILGARTHLQLHLISCEAAASALSPLALPNNTDLPPPYSTSLHKAYTSSYPLWIYQLSLDVHVFPKSTTLSIVVRHTHSTL